MAQTFINYQRIFLPSSMLHCFIPNALTILFAFPSICAPAHLCEASSSFPSRAGPLPTIDRWPQRPLPPCFDVLPPTQNAHPVSCADLSRASSIFLFCPHFKLNMKKVSFLSQQHSHESVSKTQGRYSISQAWIACLSPKTRQNFL